MRYHQTQQGFSLVETLVAITILLLVMVGPMTIATSTARSTSFASEQVTAFFLAQEGVELIQKMRDDMLLAAAGTPNGVLTASFWSTFTDSSTAGPLSDCYQSSGCAVEISTAADGAVQVVNDCSPSSNCDIYHNGGTGNIRAYFTHTSTGANITTTPYNRSVYLSETATGQVEIVSRVTWNSGGLRGVQSVEVESYVFNIYGN